MSNVLQFPNRTSERMEEDPFGAVKMLAGVPAPQFYDVVFEKNVDLLKLRDGFDVLEYLEFFTDDRYPHQVVADIGLADLRGLYVVDRDTFEMVKLADEPLVHFK